MAIIDLGTNSIRFDIYQVRDFLISDRLYRMKEMIRLGEDVFVSKKLHPKAIERSYRVLEKVRQKLKEENVDRVVAFATCALREAKNAKTFVEQVKKDFDIHIEIISGKQEAELIAQGISNNEVLPSGLSLLVDIGGGSTEISVCYKQSIVNSHSFALGAARLQQVFLEDCEKKEDKKDCIEKLQAHVKKELQEYKKDKAFFPIKTAIGSSGTIKALSRILKKQGQANCPFKTSALKKVVEKLKPLSRKQLLSIPGIEKKRVDIILAGALLYLEICKELGIEDSYTSENTLRDGILDAELKHIMKSL